MNDLYAHRFLAEQVWLGDVTLYATGLYVVAHWRKTVRWIIDVGNKRDVKSQEAFQELCDKLMD